MIVLDTCAVIWDALDIDRPTQKAQKAIRAAEANNELMISDISIREIVMLVSRKKLEMEATVFSFINLCLQYLTIVK